MNSDMDSMDSRRADRALGDRNGQVGGGQADERPVADVAGGPRRPAELLDQLRLRLDRLADNHPSHSHEPAHGRERAGGRRPDVTAERDESPDAEGRPMLRAGPTLRAGPALAATPMTRVGSRPAKSPRTPTANLRPLMRRNPLRLARRMSSGSVGSRITRAATGRAALVARSAWKAAGPTRTCRGSCRRKRARPGSSSNRGSLARVWFRQGGVVPAYGTIPGFRVQ